jgi:hypothetical protein
MSVSPSALRRSDLFNPRTAFPKASERFEAAGYPVLPNSRQLMLAAIELGPQAVRRKARQPNQERHRRALEATAAP